MLLRIHRLSEDENNEQQKSKYMNFPESNSTKIMKNIEDDDKNL
jgi:hypothetical protein